MDSFLYKVLDKVFMRAFWYRQRWQCFLGKFQRTKSVFDYCYLRFYGVETQQGFVRLVGYPIINKAWGSRIVIESGVTLVSKSQGNEAGINHPVIISTMTPEASIHIKKNVGISGSSICSASNVVIDEHSGLGANSCVYDTDFHPIAPVARLAQQSIQDARTSPIHIGKNVWLGANSIVLKGVTIGDNSVVAAGAIVSKNVTEGTLVGGVPAKFLKKFEME